MILSAFITICTKLIQFVFSWVSLPAIPSEVKTVFDTYFSYVFDNLNFLNFFINASTLKTVDTIAITLYAFEHVYKIMMWVLRKIPLSIS